MKRLSLSSDVTSHYEMLTTELNHSKALGWMNKTMACLMTLHNCLQRTLAAFVKTSSLLTIKLPFLYMGACSLNAFPSCSVTRSYTGVPCDRAFLSCFFFLFFFFSYFIYRWERLRLQLKLCYNTHVKLNFQFNFKGSWDWVLLNFELFILTWAARRWNKWRACDVGEAKEGLESELWRRWSNGRVAEWAVT